MKTITVKFKKICACSVEIEVDDNFHLEDYGGGDLEPMVRANTGRWDDNDDRAHCEVAIVEAEDHGSGERRSYRR